MTTSIIRGLLAIAALALPLAASAQSACQVTQLVQLPLEYTGFKLIPTTVGQINGRLAKMIFAAGSSVTHMPAEAAERHGLVPQLSDGEAIIGGRLSNRRTALYQALVAKFSIGPFSTSNMAMPIIDGNPPIYDVQVGADLLLRTDLELSLATKEMRFFHARDCGKDWLAYWDRNASVIPFQHDEKTMPVPEFTIHVNGVALTAHISPSDSVSVLSKRAADKIGVKTDGPNARRTHEADPQRLRMGNRWITQADTFKIGDILVRNPAITVDDSEHPEVDVKLGADFLRVHRILFAMGQRQLYVSYLGGDPFETWTEIKPWMRKEAEAGNPHAWFAMAHLAQSQTNARRDPAAARDYLERAAALGHHGANAMLGSFLLIQGQQERALTMLRAAQEPGRAGREAALWLYLARLRAGDAQVGADLTKRFEGQRDWPRPVVDYFLGKIDSATMVAATASPFHACIAVHFAQLHEEIQGKPIATPLPQGCPSLPGRQGKAPDTPSRPDRSDTEKT